ncbi:MAG: cation:proton antiporter [Synechococcus sp.]|nr:cation:proton antiporter [Synechococcus sp.]
MTEALASYLLVFGVLLIAASYLDRISERLQLPGVLLVLLLGLLADNNLSALPGETPPLLSLANAADLAQVAVGVVLFHAGLGTNWREFRGVLRPGLRLALIGSLITAWLLMLVIHALQVETLTSVSPGWGPALFIGAMVCSTDASATLAVLRPVAPRLPKRLLDLLECESGINDPVAVVLAQLGLVIAAGALLAPAADPPAAGAEWLLAGPRLFTQVIRQFGLGALIGTLVGTVAARLLEQRPDDWARQGQQHRPVLALAVIVLLLGGTRLLGGSDLLAAFIAGLVIGNSPEMQEQRLDLEQATGSYLKLAELLLFLCMGLVVEPGEVLLLLPWTLLLFVLMQLMRLVAVVPLLQGAFTPQEQVFVGFSGLRGAVPIALAITAAAHPTVGPAWGRHMPPLALGLVLLGLVLQGSLLVPLARRLRLVQQS